MRPNNGATSFCPIHCSLEDLSTAGRPVQSQSRQANRHVDVRTFTKQATLPASTNDTGEIYRSAVAILDGIHLRKSVRLFGVSLGFRERG